MKNLILVKAFIFFLSFSLINIENQHIKEDFQLIYINLYTKSIKRVESKDFEKSFNYLKKKKNITDEKLVNELKNHIEKTIKDNQIIQNLDVRFSLKIETNNQKCNIYGGLNGIEINHSKYKISNDFQKLLIQITESDIK